MPISKPPFVIVTPVLNGARYIAETLESISRQNDAGWVHYVMDGGSSDGTQDIVRKSMEGDPRRRLIEGTDRGLYDAVFKGFARAAADGFNDAESVCLWLNADDVLMPWALVSLRLAFAQYHADWITTLPCIWDAAGRLVLVSPYAWHPRALIRLGLFHRNGLGWIQQESTFFKRRLLDRAAPRAVDEIRQTKLAGDFLLWREFARHAAPAAVPIAVSGFRSHGANASSTQMKSYYRELKAAGVRLTPGWLGRLLRLLFRPVALAGAAAGVRKHVRLVSAAEDQPAAVPKP